MRRCADVGRGPAALAADGASADDAYSAAGRGTAGEGSAHPNRRFLGDGDWIDPLATDEEGGAVCGAAGDACGERGAAALLRCLLPGFEEWALFRGGGTG